MSYVIDAATKINELQLQVVTKGQSAVVGLTKTAAGYLERTPGASEPVAKLVRPITAVVGSPAEFIRSINDGNKEWAEAWLNFHTRISEVLSPTVEPAVDDVTPIKKSAAARPAKA